jgi:aspartate aminotransferase-like enzyme
MLKNDFGVNIAGGQDHLKNSLFRINNMGFIDNSEISWVLNSIEAVLDKLDIRKFDGTANRVFMEKMIFRNN